MKARNYVFALLTLFLISVLAFTVLQTASIKGTVIPASATGQVWAVSGADTAKAAFTNGVLSLVNVKAGTYKVVVTADEPYRQVVKENVVVQEGSVADLGEIRLEK